MPSYNKKEFKESNVNYLNKDFSSLKGSLINYAKSYFPNTYRDFNETSPGMMLIEMSAYVGDVLSFYIDQQYREMMLPLAEERRNVVNMAKMLGYKVKPIVPAFVDLTFKQDVTIVTDNPDKVDYSAAGTFDKGIKVTSTTNSDIIFETLDVVDFTITGSTDLDTPTTDTDSGLATQYTLERTVRAISGETKTKTFTVTAPTKFLKLTLSDTNVIDIISVVDSNGNNWYEVDYLAQDKVPVETHYTSVDGRDTAYHSLDDGDDTTSERSEVAVPYSLSYINTSKRFTTEINEDSTTSLVFGNGILKNGTVIGDSYLDLEQVGISIPGQTDSLTSGLDPLLGDEYSTLGETPVQTTLTITYRVGGGIAANVTKGDLTSVGTVTSLPGSTGTIASVTNNIPARGGKNQDSVDEIREKTKAFFTTQNRCVTKEDYEARVMNISSKFGSIAKVYVSRTDVAAQISGTPSEVFTAYTAVIEDLFTTISTATDLEILQTSATNLYGTLDVPTPAQITDIQELGTINIFVLSYDNNKNLVGNPHWNHANITSTDNVPLLLTQNIKNYLSEFKILTDLITIQDGYIINFGVFFDVVSHKHANKQEIKLLCIEKIKEYFNIDKLQFGQPIFISQLEYELMGIDGVRAVNYVTITQNNDYNGGPGYQTLGDNGTFYYSFTDGIPSTDGEPGYGWQYDFDIANDNGIILPANPNNPAVFELKNPNQNIKGVVR